MKNTNATCWCGAVGPERGRLAIAAGWTSKRHTVIPTWLCPEHSYRHVVPPLVEVKNATPAEPQPSAEDAAAPKRPRRVPMLGLMLMAMTLGPGGRR